MSFVDKLLDGSFMPHGHCFLWRGDLLFLHVAGDLTTALAYILIPFVLVRLVIIRDDLRFNSIFLLFAGFILFCGLTHIIDVVNVWHGYYYIEGGAKVATGLISITTAIVLWRLVPVLVAMPPPGTTWRSKWLNCNRRETRFRKQQIAGSEGRPAYPGT